MNPSDKENMKIVDDILIKVIAGGVSIARSLRGTFDSRNLKEEARIAREAATAIVKPKAE